MTPSNVLLRSNDYGRLSDPCARHARRWQQQNSSLGRKHGTCQHTRQRTEKPPNAVLYSPWVSRPLLVRLASSPECCRLSRPVSGSSGT